MCSPFRCPGNLSRILEEARNSDDLNLIISLSASDGRPGSQLFVRAHSVGQKIAWVQALFHVMQEEGDGMADSAVGGEGTSTTPRVAQPKIIENLWREADKCAMQGILIKLPTSTKTADAEKKLARAAASDSFFAQDQLPRGAEYVWPYCLDSLRLPLTTTHKENVSVTAFSLSHFFANHNACWMIDTGFSRCVAQYCRTTISNGCFRALFRSMGLTSGA